MSGLPVEVPIVLIYSQVNLLGEGLFLIKGPEYISAISFKKTPTQCVSYMGSAQQLF